MFAKSRIYKTIIIKVENKMEENQEKWVIWVPVNFHNRLKIIMYLNGEKMNHLLKLNYFVTANIDI